MVLSYKYSREEIKGTTVSKLAKRETKDCVVRAMAVALNLPYDTAHGFVKETMKREDRKGTKQLHIDEAMEKFQESGLELVGRRYEVKVLEGLDIKNAYKLRGEVILRKKTVKSFIKSHQKGTFVISVAGHTFTIKDGVLIDNIGEEFRPTRKVQAAYKIEDTLSKNQLSFEF